jgi:CTP:molybdopterin cytidylyltransferase MocA
MTTITALILAAGYGTRIGKPKLMLEKNGESFLSIILKNLQDSPLDKICCITNKDNTEWVNTNFPDLQTIINANPENGMLSSVYRGVNFKQSNSEGYLIIPVDHPFVKKETYNILVEKFLENPESIIKPYFQNSHGHPIIIPQSLIKNIPESGIKIGLKEIIKKSGLNQIIVETDDEGILKNINYPGDLI